jgi:hypothetical protein
MPLVRRIQLKRLFKGHFNPPDAARLFAVITALLCCSSVKANVIQGTILGIFSSPALIGSIANDPALGQSTVLDNTNTAVYSINNSTDPTLGGTPLQQLTGSALNWGVLTGSSGPSTFSTLTFFGRQIPANINTPFQLGTITFSNGTSDLNSLIFGATLSFYDNVVSPSTFLGSDRIYITTTNNIAGTPPVDDDYINICGNNSNICASSIEAVEATEGGTGVTVYLFGTIVGDPMINIGSVALAPNQSGATNGFIGTDPPIGANTSPEPGTWTLLAAGLALGIFRLRRKH